MTNLYLTPTEQKAVAMLANGDSYETIIRAAGWPIFRIAWFFARLRRKTGIESTKIPQLARDYLEAVANARGPFALQLKWIKQLATQGMPPGVTEGALYPALRAAGILATNPVERRVQCGIFLAHREMSATPAPAFTPQEKAILRRYAKGEHAWHIARALGEIDPPQVEALIKRACAALHARARGRGVQRRLLGIALDAMEQKRAQIDPLSEY